MSRLRVAERAADVASLRLVIDDAPMPEPGPGQCLIEVAAAAVNPSDVKAALGLMPHAVWPRTPGRDYAGIVRRGPPGLEGQAVWGSGGELGIRRDGSHSRWLVLDAAAVRPKPAALTMAEAGAAGVPFVTASEGFREAGGIKAGDVVLVAGANGKVGQAAVQLALWAGARVFGAVRRAGAAAPGVRTIDASRDDVAAVVRDETGGHGADIVYNTVGSPYFAAANQAMAVGGRQIFIATLDRAVPFDIFAFYRGRHRYVGVDSLALDAAACGAILDALAPGFEAGALKPFPVPASSMFPLADAAEAYRRVLGGAADRLVLRPSPQLS